MEEALACFPELPVQVLDLAIAAMLVSRHGLLWTVELVCVHCEPELQVLVGLLQCSGDYSVAIAKLHDADSEDSLAMEAACLVSSAARVAGLEVMNQAALELPGLQVQEDLIFCSHPRTGLRCSCLQEGKPAHSRLELASDLTRHWCRAEP